MPDVRFFPHFHGAHITLLTIMVRNNSFCFKKAHPFAGGPMTNPNVQIGYRIPLDDGFKKYVDSTYEPFLALARGLYPSSQLLTDHEDIVQLQNLHFLLRQGVLRITEEKSQEGAPSLFLEIVVHPEP